MQTPKKSASRRRPYPHNVELIAAYSGASVRTVKKAITHGLDVIKDAKLRALVKLAIKCARGQ